MRTQREFIKATATQVLNIKNVGKINDLIEDISSNLETDLPTEEILKYVPSLISFNTDDLVMEQLQGETRTLNKISFFFECYHKRKR
jgi:anionic cell wall polymer biosynthesis LytR-Cps2A-Psr (LCP) family protein